MTLATSARSPSSTTLHTRLPSNDVKGLSAKESANVRHATEREKEAGTAEDAVRDGMMTAVMVNAVVASVAEMVIRVVEEATDLSEVETNLSAEATDRLRAKGNATLETEEDVMMTKINKSFLLLTFLLSAMTAMAQDKLFTLEDLNYGGTNYHNMTPENKWFEWWGDELVRLDIEVAM